MKADMIVFDEAAYIDADMLDKFNKLVSEQKSGMWYAQYTETKTMANTYYDRRCERPRRPACDCYECMEHFTYDLRRCGCNRCYDEYQYTKDRQRGQQYRSHRETYQYTQMLNMQINPLGQLKPMRLTSGEKDMNLVEKVKNLKLSAADKLLRKHDVVDAEGDLTETGQELIWAKLLDQFKDELVADLKAVDASEKKCK